MEFLSNMIPEFSDLVRTDQEQLLRNTILELLILKVDRTTCKTIDKTTETLFFWVDQTYFFYSESSVLGTAEISSTGNSRKSRLMVYIK